MEPDYVAKKSILGECGGKIFICILFCWLIVPIFLMIYMIIEAKKFRIEFYKDKVIMYRGFLHTEEQQSILTTIVGVRINRSIAGNISITAMWSSIWSGAGISTQGRSKIPLL